MTAKESLDKKQEIGKKVGEARVVPGERSALLLAKRDQYIAKAITQTVPAFISSAKGVLVQDIDGNEYIDFACGYSVLNIGHCHDEVTAAVKEQADKFLHISFNIFFYTSFVELAEKLTEITPGSFPKQVVFANTGSEAVENAIKIARRYTGRHGIITFEDAFHGRTGIAMNATSRVKYIKFGFGTQDPSIHRFPYAYTYRAPFKTTDAEYGEYCVKRIEDGLNSYIAPEETAAILVEPFLGEGGYIIPPPEFIKGLRRLCDKYNLLLIADEIQSGIGRTGKMWAIEHFDVIPDLLITSKSLAGGMVLSAVVGKKDIMDAVDSGGLGGTFSGHPLACVAALKVLEIIEKERLLARATELGKVAKDKLEKMKMKYQLIGDVRGLGCAIGIELVKDRETKEPATEETAAIIKYCYEHGLIVLNCGLFHNILRLMFPLVIEKSNLLRGLDILESSIRETGS